MRASLPRAPLAESAPSIRVLLRSALPSVEVSGWDIEALAPDGSRPAVRRAGRQQWLWRCRSGKIELEGAEKAVFSGPLEIRSPAGTLTWGSTIVRETLVLRPERRGCSVANRLDIEKYLDGVVNGEFSSKWSPEAVSAQVIAARSYALYQIRDARRRHAEFDVVSDTRDQVYLGTRGEDAQASRLVAMSRGMILAAGDPGKLEPVKAYYHSTCGGRTDSPENVFRRPQEGVRGGVVCAHCGTSPRFSWEFTLAPAQLAQALEPIGRGSPSAIEVLSRFPSGRVKELRATFGGTGDRASSEVIPGARFRALVGSEKLRSTAFTVSRGEGDSWVFSGRGFGHGVGMCQWGAKEMGTAGYTVREILSRYYPEARLARAWR